MIFDGSFCTGHSSPLLVNGSDDLNMSKEIKTKKNELKGKGASHVKISVFIATTLLLSTYIPNDLQKKVIT